MSRFATLIALFLVLGFSAPAADAPAGAQKKAADKIALPAGVKVLREVEYRQGEGSALKLDLYLPEQTAAAPWPVVVWVLGGWNKGGKERCPAVWLVPEGVAVASIQYRLSAEASWPAHLDPPFLIIHGEKDPGVPLEQSARLHEKLQAAGVESTLHLIPGAGHGGSEFSSPEQRRLILAFFSRHLKPGDSTP